MLCLVMMTPDSKMNFHGCSQANWNDDESSTVFNKNILRQVPETFLMASSVNENMDSRCGQSGPIKPSNFNGSDSKWQTPLVITKTTGLDPRLNLNSVTSKIRSCTKKRTEVPVFSGYYNTLKFSYNKLIDGGKKVGIKKAFHLNLPHLLKCFEQYHPQSFFPGPDSVSSIAVPKAANIYSEVCQSPNISTLSYLNVPSTSKCNFALALPVHANDTAPYTDDKTYSNIGGSVSNEMPSHSASEDEDDVGIYYFPESSSSDSESDRPCPLMCIGPTLGYLRYQKAATAESCPGDNDSLTSQNIHDSNTNLLTDDCHNDDVTLPSQDSSTSISLILQDCHNDNIKLTPQESHTAIGCLPTLDDSSLSVVGNYSGTTKEMAQNMGKSKAGCVGNSSSVREQKRKYSEADSGESKNSFKNLDTGFTDRNYSSVVCNRKETKELVELAENRDINLEPVDTVLLTEEECSEFDERSLLAEIKEETIEDNLEANIMEETVEYSLVGEIKMETVEDFPVSEIKMETVENVPATNVGNETVKDPLLIMKEKCEFDKKAPLVEIKEEAIEDNLEINCREEIIDDSLLCEVRMETVGIAHASNAGKKSAEDPIVNMEENCEFDKKSLLVEIKEEAIEDNVETNIMEGTVEDSHLSEVKMESVEDTPVTNGGKETIEDPILNMDENCEFDEKLLLAEIDEETFEDNLEINVTEETVDDSLVKETEMVTVEDTPVSCVGMDSAQGDLVKVETDKETTKYIVLNDRVFNKRKEEEILLLLDPILSPDAPVTYENFKEMLLAFSIEVFNDANCSQLYNWDYNLRKFLLFICKQDEEIVMTEDFKQYFHNKVLFLSAWKTA